MEPSTGAVRRTRRAAKAEAEFTIQAPEPGTCSETQRGKYTVKMLTEKTVFEKSYAAHAHTEIAEDFESEWDGALTPGSIKLSRAAFHFS
jgi:hypothetical protein